MPPIFQDDFESYSPGNTLPLGSNWTGSNGLIVAGLGPYPSNGQVLRLTGGTAQYTDVSVYRASFSVFFTFLMPAGQGGQLAIFANGPNSLAQTFDILLLQIEPDATVTVKLPGGAVIANSRDSIAAFDTFHFIQLNVQLSDYTSGGVGLIRYVIHVALDGKEIISKSYDSGAGVGSLKNGTAEINRYSLQSELAFYDNFTLDTLKSIVTYPNPGSPQAIIAHAVGEVIEEKDDSQIIIPSAILELARLPNSAKLIIPHAVIELLILREITQGKWKVKEY